MTAVAKITSKGQITLPKEVRRLLNVHVGSIVIFEKEDENLVIKPAKTFKEYRGYLKGTKQAMNFEDIRKKAKEYIGKKVAHHGNP